jgi:hypothetical protein
MDVVEEKKEEEEFLPADILNASAEEVETRIRLLENEIRVIVLPSLTCRGERGAEEWGGWERMNIAAWALVTKNVAVLRTNALRYLTR